MSIFCMQTENTENVETITETPKANGKDTTRNKAIEPKNDKRRKGYQTVVEEDDDGGKRKPIKPRSWVWDHFNKVVGAKSKISQS